MTKVFTRLQLKQILKQNLTNKILESKKSTPIQKKNITRYYNSEYFFWKNKLKTYIFFIYTWWKSAESTKKRHKNTVDIFFRGSNKFHKIHA